MKKSRKNENGTRSFLDRLVIRVTSFFWNLIRAVGLVIFDAIKTTSWWKRLQRRQHSRQQARQETNDSPSGKNNIRQTIKQYLFHQKPLSPPKQRLQIGRRVRLLFFCAVCLLVVMGVYVTYLSMRDTNTNTIRELSSFNYNTTVDTAMPGDILDANETVIAGSYSVYVLCLDPKVLYETEELREGSFNKTIEALVTYFGLDEEHVRKTFEDNPTSSYLRYFNPDMSDGTTSRKTLVSDEQRENFQAYQTKINAGYMGETDEDGNEIKSDGITPRIAGVNFEREARRTYPFGTYASKIIGFATKETTQGLWGLEKSYDSDLRGTDGRMYGYMNDDTTLERDLQEREDGHTLVTTLDMNLEKLITDELDAWLAATDENGEKINSAKSVSILVMDPDTSAIRAFVTDSEYDLNNPSSSENLKSQYSDEEIAVFVENQAAYNVAALAAQEAGETFSWDFDEYPTTTYKLNEVWRNNLISNSYEPGSTGKVMTYAAALEENAILPTDEYDCLGDIPVANYLIKCHNYVAGGCGHIDALQGLANSCNVAFINIGQALGRTAFAKYQQLFNFGQKTGIDLPGEASCEGLLYTEEQLNDTELATNAFGQSYNVTMLQLATAFCSAINGGYYYQPYVVSEIRSADGSMISSHEPVLVRQTISEQTSTKVREALRAVVTSETGTGGNIIYSHGEPMDGYSFIAKTGTAEKLPRSDKKYLVSVISAVPQEHPEAVLYVVIDEYGGELQADSYPAQELTGNIWGSILDYLGIYPDNASTADQYRYATGSEGWANGDVIMQGADGDPDNQPLPPEDDGSGIYSELIISPDDVLNPNDVLPQIPTVILE